MNPLTTTRSLRVLHLEDSPRDAEVVRHKLDVEGVTCDILVVSNKDSFEAALKREPFALILLDYDLSDYDGLTALKHAQLTMPEVPVIFISGTVDDEGAVNCLHIGATDYLLKDRLDRLAPAVQRAVQEAETRRIQKRAEAALVDLRDAIDQHAVVATTDARGSITFVNDRFCDVSGYSRAELVGQDHRLTNSSYHSKAFMLDLWTTIQEGRVWHGEIRNRAKEGSFYWLDTTIVPFLNDDGSPRKYMAICAVVTDRKKAERALRDERDLAQQYLDTAQVILLRLDEHGRIALVNRYGCSVLGWPPDQLIGRDWFETCLPPGIRDEVRERFHHTLGGDLAVTETPVLTRSGNELLIEWRTSLTRDNDGRVVGTFSSGSDITQRKRAEEEIRRGAQRSAQAERELRALFIANPLPMWIYDVATLQFLEVNDAAVWRYGYARDEFLGMTIRDIRPPEEAEGSVGDSGSTRETCQAAGNWRHLLKSGQVIEVDVTSHTITFAERRAALVVAQDITERNRGVEALRISEERTRFALEAAGVGIWDMDCTTGVLRCSATMEAQYGLLPGTLAGTFTAFVEHVHPDDRTTVFETVEKAMSSGSDFSMLSRAIWPDGTVRWLSGAGRVRLGQHGEPVLAVGISLDVSDRRTLEQQFQQAQKMEAVGQLAGGVAHDFNNLLTVILGFCELLLADLGGDDPRHADIVEIQKAGIRAAGLTRQLLAFSRKQIIEPVRLDLNAVVADMQAMLRRLIREDVRVVLRLSSELALVKADRGEVEQVVMNLAVNARDAMPNGGTLTIETANVALDEHYAKTHVAVKPGPHVSLTVSDTGTGMTSEVRARLFEPFFTTKEPGKGTGLGMATVYGIVTRSGGSVAVESEVGRGSSFKVYFPRADAAERLMEPPAAHARPIAATQTVLLVEDEEGLREMAKRLLVRQGCTVLVARDAVEAVRLFEENPSIDVLLTDVVMPGTSGPELVGQLVARRPGLKVIYMSGYSDEAIVQHGLLNPGIAFLHKPFTSDTLGRKVREVLER